jgi:hypothetical protein
MTIPALDQPTLISVLLFLNIFFMAIVYIMLGLMWREQKRPIVVGDEDEEELMKDAKEKSTNILERSIKNANKIISNAELRGLGMMAKQKIDSKKIVEMYEHNLIDLEAKLKNEIEMTMKNSTASYTDFMARIEQMIQQTVESNQKNVLEKTEAFIAQAEKDLGSLIGEVQGQVKIQVTNELSLAKGAIDEYKRRRMSIIDENIIDILERTLTLTLQKKLTLKDQSELIYRALEEAKNEDIFN